MQTELEARIAQGDRYLSRNPDDTEAKALYFRLLAQYTTLRLAEESRLVVTLELPSWASTPDGGHIIRVCVQGQRHDGEMDRDDLAILNDAMALARA